MPAVCRGDSGPARPILRDKSCSESRGRMTGLRRPQGTGRFAVLSAVLEASRLWRCPLADDVRQRRPEGPGAFATDSPEASPVQPGARRSAQLKTSDSNRMMACWRAGSDPRETSRLPGANDRLVAGGSHRGGLPAAYLLYEVEDERSPSSLLNSPGHTLERKKKHIKGVELYARSSTASPSRGGRRRRRPSVRRVSTDRPARFWTSSCCAPRASGSRGSVPHAPSGGELQVTVGDGAGVRSTHHQAGHGHAAIGGSRRCAISEVDHETNDPCRRCGHWQRSVSHPSRRWRVMRSNRAPGHPNPQAAADMATVASRGDVALLPPR